MPDDVDDAEKESERVESLAETALRKSKEAREAAERLAAARAASSRKFRASPPVETMEVEGENKEAEPAAAALGEEYEPTTKADDRGGGGGAGGDGKNDLTEPLLPESAPGGGGGGSPYPAARGGGGGAPPPSDRDSDSDRSPRSEQRKEQERARSELDALLNETRPKNFTQGFSRGLDALVTGAVGAIGAAVLVPTAFAVTAREAGGGWCDAACCFASGCCVGVCTAACLVLSGVCGCFTNTFRGLLAAPEAVTQPRRGKWWDETEGKWIETDLETERRGLEHVPEDDADILKAAKNDADGADRQDGEGGVVVKDTSYYDALQVKPNATPSQIKKQYYALARRYHPDKAGSDDEEAAAKFKEVSEAYQVLSDPDLRSRYDAEGKDGLSPDKTAVASGAMNVDPAMLFAFLFGSDKFEPYVGVLATATSAKLGDGSDRIGHDDARTLQKRRCVRLALKLAERLDGHVYGDEEGAIDAWRMEAEGLIEASYGRQLLDLIGSVYSLAATEFLGSLDSGIGLPSISAWAKSQAAERKLVGQRKRRRRETVYAGLSIMEATSKYEISMRQASTEEERSEIRETFEREVANRLLAALWATTSVDVTSTLHVVCQMVFFDKNVDAATRRKRGEAVRALGEVFLEASKPKTRGGKKEDEDEEEEEDARKLYEEAAFAAMLETVKRKDEAAFDAATK